MSWGNVSFTQPLSPDEIAEMVARVVARSDPEFALDMITGLQLQVRIVADTGERLSFEDVALRHGFDLAKLRIEHQSWGGV